jgi:hypothetical protein
MVDIFRQSEKPLVQLEENCARPTIARPLHAAAVPIERGPMITRTITRTLLVVLLASGAGVALAQAQLPEGAIMLVPGVYTTPEISAKCGAYARSRTQPHEDSRRQTLALACAQKLWNGQLRTKPVSAPRQ